ncbi:MAG: tetratricopeptide repeat protein [Acidobacteriota bacterium]
MDTPAEVTRKQGPPTGLPSKKRLWLAAVGLALVTFALFSPLLGAHFVGYDDNMVVTRNPLVQKGLTWEGVRYYWSHMAGGFYAPLTYLSHMLDCQLFGLWAGGHHLTNILLHVAATLLLLLFLVRATGAPWRSLFVAALFALHPLHVESVAWVAERKDVLSALFFVLTLLAYLHYARRPGWARYGWVVAALLLGLLSKAMLVTAPFLLLLLDYWPLGRMPGRLGPGPEGWPAAAKENPIRSWTVLILEKLPLLALCLFFSWLTAQDQPIIGFHRMPLPYRLMNAAIAYGHYTLLTFVPHGLAVFYPLDFKAITMGRALAWGLPVAAFTLLALVSYRRRPYLAVGWFWFVGMLVPVIGLVQIGAQARADRYAYLPSIGLFIAIAWALAEAMPARRWARNALLAAVACWLVGLVALSAFQVTTWHDTYTLFRQDYAVTHDNARAARFLGQILAQEGRIGEAIPYYREALRIVPTLDVARLELAALYGRTGQMRQAAELLLKGMVVSPHDPELEAAFLGACGRLPDPAEQAELLAKACRLRPESYALHLAWGRSLLAAGQLAEATKVLQEAAASRTKEPQGWCYLGHALFEGGLERPAADAFERALTLSPRDPSALAGLAWVLLKARDPSLRDPARALRLAREAVRLSGGRDPYAQTVLAAAEGERTKSGESGGAP